MSLKKAVQTPSFSGQRVLFVSTSRRESIQGLDFSDPNSLQESFGFPIISGPSFPTESSEVPLLSTFTSSKGTLEGRQSSDLWPPVEFAKNDSSRSASPSSPRESAQPSPAASPRLLSKTFTYPYSSGPSISQQPIEASDFSVPTSHKESMQVPALSGPNSIRESFEFPTISESRSTRESFAAPSLYTSSSSIISTQMPMSSDLKLPTEYVESECVHSPSSSSPRGSAQPSPISSPRLPKKPMSSFFSGPDVLKQSVDGPSSMSSLRRESRQGPDFSVPTSLKESFDFPIFSGPNSVSEYLEVSPLSISRSSKGSNHILPSSGSRSPVEYRDNESVNSASPSSPKEYKKLPPPSGPNLINKYTQIIPISESNMAKECIEFPDFSTSSSQRKFIQDPAFFDSNSMMESFDFHIFSGATSIRQSLDGPLFSPSSSLRGSTKVLPSSGLRSPIEYAEDEKGHYLSSSSPREPKQPSHLSSLNLWSKCMQFPSFSGPSVSKQPIELQVSSMLRSQRDSIQDTASLAPNSLRESFESPVFPGPSSTRKSLEVHPVYSRSKSTKESLPVIPISGLISVKEPEEDKISAAVSQHSVSNFMEVLALKGLSFRPEFMQVHLHLILSHPQELPEGLHISHRGSQRQFLQVPISPSESSQKEYMDLSPSSISQRKSIHISASSRPSSLRESICLPPTSISSQRELDQVFNLSSPNSQRESMGVLPSTSSSQRESIQVLVSSSQSSQRELLDVALYNISSQRKLIHILLSKTTSLRESGALHQMHQDFFSFDYEYPR
ncbi:serine-rich adhesin for platelets-like [Petaurus breviceps papuanus]|uniref:serine-rich adhesin for platelets-like n=1 Tax=Petaurus breviceps papuanus TaxID=3040969 RepID=UPI0036DDE6E2